MGALCARRAVSGVKDSEECSAEAVQRWEKLTRHAVRIARRKRIWAALGHFFNFEFKARLREAGLK
jgi:hypothetical protein